LKAKLDDLKNQANQKALEDKIKATLGLKPSDNLPSDLDQKIVGKNKYDKIQRLHDIIRTGAELKVGKK